MKNKQSIFSVITIVSIVGVTAVFSLIDSSYSRKDKSAVAPAEAMIAPTPSHPIGVSLPTDTAPRFVHRESIAQPAVAAIGVRPALPKVQSKSTTCLQAFGRNLFCVVRTVRR